MVEVDQLRIERVIVNLVTNTLKYSTPGTPIDLLITGVADQVRLELSDRSPGMSAEVAARVFDKYHRAAATRQIEGLGIGLYACKRMIEAHGGRIWARSTVGEGSEFAFALPIEGAR